VAAVNGSFLYLAITRKPASTTNAPYEESLTFQKKLDENQTAQQSFRHAATGSCSAASCSVSLTLDPVHEQALPDTVRLRLQHAGTAKTIIQETAPLKSNGVYTLSHSQLKPGIWFVEGEYSVKSAPAYFQTRLFIQ
jgi:nitrogen fixation protein FixH